MTEATKRSWQLDEIASGRSELLEIILILLFPRNDEKRRREEKSRHREELIRIFYCKQILTATKRS